MFCLTTLCKRLLQKKVFGLQAVEKELEKLEIDHVWIPAIIRNTQLRTRESIVDRFNKIWPEEPYSRLPIIYLIFQVEKQIFEISDVLQSCSSFSALQLCKSQ